MIRATRFVVCIGLMGIWLSSARALGDDDKREALRTGPEAQDREKQTRRENFERRTAELNRRIEELRADNRPDQAAEVERDLKNLIQKMREETVRDSQDLIRRQIEELRAVGRNQEATKVEEQLREALDGEKKRRAAAEDQEHRARESRERLQQAVRDSQPGENGPEDLDRRLKHIQEAAENLAAAGLKEQAEQLRRQAEMMRRQALGPPDVRPQLEELRKLIRQQGEHIERLEQTMQKLLDRSTANSSGTGFSGKDSKTDAKALAYAEFVIKKYDKNGDGSLTKDEWSSMSKDPQRADKDGDGKITAAEFAAWTFSN